MTVETKFNIGDEVWLMYDNMAITAQVIEMNVEIRENYLSVVNANCYCKIKSPHFTREIHDSRIFPTKEELLKSL
jgi:hypothetical protein